MQKLTQEFLNQPGVCLVCNVGQQREWYLDTGIYLDYVGSFYICNYCVVDMIHAVGGLTEDELTALSDAHKEELHYVQMELELEHESNGQLNYILPLTIAEIVEKLNGIRPVDPVPDESERPVDVEPVESDGSVEQAIIDTDDFKLAKLDGAVHGFTLDW